MHLCLDVLDWMNHVRGCMNLGQDQLKLACSPQQLRVVFVVLGGSGLDPALLGTGAP